MTNEIAAEAIKGIIAAMGQDAKELTERVQLAADDIADNERTRAMGALCGLDDTIERIAASLSAARAISRAAK